MLTKINNLILIGSYSIHKKIAFVLTHSVGTVLVLVCTVYVISFFVIAETSSNLPLTVERLFPALLYLASKWQSLGKALSLNKDRLDEIFTNNKTDEACLREMLKVYMMRSDLKHSWKEIHAAINIVESKQEETDESTHPDPQTPPGLSDNILSGKIILSGEYSKVDGQV